MAVTIGIPVPMSRDLEDNRVSGPDYAKTVRLAGADVLSIELARGLQDWRGVASGCDGFVLPGSPSDVNPVLYGEASLPTTAPPDPEREACDGFLLDHAAATGKPVLAICYGVQRLNTWRGGTLVQDLTPMPLNHAAGAGVAVAHSIAVAAQSLLGRLLSDVEAPTEGPFRRLPVNSSHHQAIAIPGDSLVVVARAAQDGVIEAVEGRIGLAAMVGVQWHPERSVAISAASRALFSWLVAEAEDGQARRIEEQQSAWPV